MRLDILSRDPHQPCLLLQLKNITVLLDCGLYQSSLQHFLPAISPGCSINYSANDATSFNCQTSLPDDANVVEVSGHYFVDSQPEVCPPETVTIDFSLVDAIFISNCYSMTALPFITEHTEFQGKVYATDPTLQIGRLLMEELATFGENCANSKRDSAWKRREILSQLPHPLCSQIDAAAWQTLYSLQDVKSSVSKVQPVGFNEKFNLFGLLDVLALSSGSSIGSCNWLLSNDYYKISYITSSSLFTTHPQPMRQSSIKDSNVMILNALTNAPTVTPDGMLREFCSHLAVTLKSGGNVLVPCYPSGVVYDLFDYLAGFLENSGLASVPMYFLSPVADSTLAYANIYAEWLCTSKLSKIYLPEAPFPHGELLKSGQLKAFANLHSGLNTAFKSPALVFCGHPSLRYGDVVHLIKLWGKSSANSIIFIEPDFPHLEALAPYQPMEMKAFYCPIDPRLNYGQANKLIKELQPKHLIVPEVYTRPPAVMSHRSDLMLTAECPMTRYKFLDSFELPLPEEFEKVKIANELALTLKPKDLNVGVSIATVEGVLITRDNLHTIQPIGKDHISGSAKALFGNLPIDTIIDILEKNGISGAQVEEMKDGYSIHFNENDAFIKVTNDNTNIVCHGNNEFRIQLRDALLSNLIAT